MIEEAFNSNRAPAATLDENRGIPQLIASCQGLVRSIAWKVHQKLPPTVEMDDLISYGQLGLAQAARDYDVSRGNQFTTFAYYRIRGAIFDGLAQMSWFSIHDYHKFNYRRRADLVLEDAHASESLEFDGAWLHRTVGALSVVYLASELKQGQVSSRQDMADDPATEAVFRELCSRLQELIAKLPGVAGEIIRDTYFNGVTLQAAATRLGISKSWASRIHSRTLSDLHRSLCALTGEDQ